MVTELSNSTLTSCQHFKCSGRGLILPFGNWLLNLVKYFLHRSNRRWTNVLGIESCMSNNLRAVLYFIFLLYLFVGIAIIADIFMSAIEMITSRRRKVRYPDPDNPNKLREVEIRVWNDTVANLTLMALGSSSPEILLSIIEIVGNRFEAGELGPGTSKASMEKVNVRKIRRFLLID